MGNSLIKVDENGNIIPIGFNDFNAMYFPSPDYANIESINRISTVDGSWTVEKDGYVRCNTGFTGVTNRRYLYFNIKVNDITVIALSDTTYTGANLSTPLRAFLPVFKGDVVSYNVQTDDTTTLAIECYYMPIRWSKTSGQPIEDSLIKVPNYSAIENVFSSNVDTTTYTADKTGWYIIGASAGTSGDTGVYRVIINGVSIITHTTFGNTESSDMIFVKTGDTIQVTLLFYTTPNIRIRFVPLMEYSL